MSITTPFGRRPVTLGQIVNQLVARDMPEKTFVHKWHVFAHIREARALLGASDRALAILNALLTFHRETVLTADGSLVVWPSNQLLATRSNGLAPSTLRRHLANLVACGLIIRRDSPNGKRFARKGGDGQIERAFGFDLAPIVARAEEFKNLAETVRREREAYRAVREELTLCRRDVIKLIEIGRTEAVPGDWAAFEQRYDEIVARLPRTAPRQVVQAILGNLVRLNQEIHNILEMFVKSQKMNANELQNERHIQISKSEPSCEFEQSSPVKKGHGGISEASYNVRSLPKRDLPLGVVLKACPDIVHLDRGGEIRSGRDLLAVADRIRTMLRVSPSAWNEAKSAMGDYQAAVTIAAIYMRASQINSAGGYLRKLTELAKDGKFSAWPMIMALERARLADR